MIEVSGVLYVTFEFLSNLGVKASTIKLGVHRNSRQWQSTRHPDDKRCLLIRYETLGTKYKKLIHESIGNPYEYSSTTILKNYVRTNPTAMSFFQEHYPKKKAIQLTQVVSWFDFLNHWITKAQIRKLNAPIKTRKELLEAVQTIMLNEIDAFKISNFREFCNRLKRYKDEGMDCFIHKNLRNQNARKITKEVGKKLLAIAGQPCKMPLSRVAFFYNQKNPKLQLSGTAIENWLNLPENRIVWESMRHGTSHSYKKFAPTITRENARHPDTMWNMDGTPVDLYYRGVHPVTGKVNNFRTIQIFCITDVHSWKILGYCLSDSENHVTVIRALKDAVRKTQRLPRQILYDNGSAADPVKETLKAMENRGVIAFPAKAKAPKSKVIEPLFGHFQQEHFRYFNNWSGQNITARKDDSRFNPDNFKKHVSELPTREELEMQIHQLVILWNHSEPIPDGKRERRKKPTDLYRKELSTGYAIEPLDFADMFWVRRKKTIKYQTEGICMEVEGVKHKYQVITDDGSFYTHHLGESFEIKYDPDNLEYVHLYQDGKPVIWQGQTVIASKEYIPMALHDMSEGDGVKRARLQAHQKAVKKHINEGIEQAWQDVETYDLRATHENVHKDAYNSAEAELKALLANVSDEPSIEEMYNNTL